MYELRRASTREDWRLQPRRKTGWKGLALCHFASYLEQGQTFFFIFLKLGSKKEAWCFLPSCCSESRRGGETNYFVFLYLVAIGTLLCIFF